MIKIGAWIRNPKNNWLKGQTKKSALFELFCEDPDSCDLLRLESTCLNCSGVSSCKFGRKVSTSGPTPAARSFYSTLDKWRTANEGFISKLKSLTAYNRIFKTHGHFYLPYSFMTGVFGYYYPLESQWVAEADMTTELLGKLCTARPHAAMGGEITDYQKKEVPKFISDLKMFYPDVFDRLPQEQKDRLKTVSYVGRKAELITCRPGRYIFSRNYWEWDGTVLHGRSMLFQPVKGEITITIKPEAGESVQITSNDQVDENTRFLD